MWASGYQQFKRGISLLMLLLTFSLRASDYLTIQDIRPVTAKILSVHLLYKEIDETLLVRIIDNYFQEFDPLKLYLLQSEVDSYVHSTPEFYKEQLVKFKNQDYSLFEEINRVIQKSIWRSRQYSRQFAQQQTFSSPATLAISSRRSFDMTQPLAKSVQQLQAHWQAAWEIADPDEKEAFREWLTQNENEYIYRNAQGVTLDEPNKQHLLTLRILKAIASSLDAHTAVFSEQQASSIRERLEQTYIGVGLWFENQGGRWIIKQVVKDSPAEKSGAIEVGDELVSINGNSVQNQGQALDWMRGELGQRLRLVIEHQGISRSVELQLEEMSLDNGRVRCDYREDVNGGIIGYIGMDSFYESSHPSGPSSYTDMLAAIRKLQAKGRLQALILDLRGNGGGFVDQAVKVVGLFITTGVVAIAKYSDGSMSYYRDTDPHRVFDGPLLVMTSRLSASASEIVAQALHDYGVALVMGDSATFGKGSIQLQTLMDRQANAFYKVTVGRYYTVSGESTQLRGVPIDFVVPGPLNNRAIGESYETQPLTSDQVAAAYVDSLTDVSFSDKLWFVQHYLPYIQHASRRWKSSLPRLQQTSGQRVQSYFKQKAFERRSSEELMEFQLDEAYRIAQDMVQTGSV